MDNQPMPANQLVDKIDDITSLVDCAEIAMCGLIAEGVNSESSANGIRTLLIEIADRLRNLSLSLDPHSRATKGADDD